LVAHRQLVAAVGSEAAATCSSATVLVADVRPIDGHITALNASGLPEEVTQENKAVRVSPTEHDFDFIYKW